MARRIASLRTLSRLQTELEKLFRDTLDLTDDSPGADGFLPRLDIVETSAAILLLFEVPGLTAGDLRVEVQGDHLTVEGNKRAWKPPQGPSQGPSRFLAVERTHGSFSRRVKLSWPVNSHRCRAWLADGLLRLEFPKVQEKRQLKRRIEVEEE